jgi:peptidoglycan-associated lipoprotein
MMKTTYNKTWEKMRIVYFRDLLKNRNTKTNLMKLVRPIVLSAIALFISAGVFAQSKYTKKADEEFANGGYTDAAQLYQSAEVNVKGIEEKGRVLYQIGECFRLTTEYGKSLEWYNKAITAQYHKTNPDVFLNYGKAFQEMGKWDDAIVQFKKYKDNGGNKTTADNLIAACGKAAELKAATKTKYKVDNVADLNTPFFDYTLTYSTKTDKEIVFSSSRQASTGNAPDPKTGESFMDIFIAERDKKGKWGAPTPIGNTVNTTSHEGVAAYDSDYKTMYFTRCEYDNKDRFACDIFYSKKQGQQYQAALPLNVIDRASDDSSMVGHPALTPDDKFLIFATDMPGGKGGKDLWYITWDKKADVWSSAKNLGAINTAGDEMFPWVASDGTLYFASNGHLGMGGLDIFKAEKTGDLTYGAPSAMDYPVNSSSDDFALVLDKDSKNSGFFTSNRPGGKGKDDIYYFSEPPLEFELIGIVYDESTGSPLANANVVVVDSDGKQYPITTDGNGGFSMTKEQILINKSFRVDVSKDQYIGTGDSFSTIGLKESQKFYREYFLEPIIVTKEYPMPLVLYPYNEAVLLVNDTVNSQDSLNYLFDLMTQNPKFVIQLESHTDFRGKDDYNQKLSQKRAETCVNYLISKGIDPKRLRAAGKGEGAPRQLLKDSGPFKKDTILTEAMITKLPADQQEIAHQLNRRTVFKIVDTNYVPKP